MLPMLPMLRGPTTANRSLPARGAVPGTPPVPSLPSGRSARRRSVPNALTLGGLLFALVVGAFVLGSAGCDEKIDGGPVEPYEPPAFVLPDLNPYSPTYLQDLSPQDSQGGVLLLYFASYT